MEIQDIRRQRLRQLIDERYEGSQARLVQETGENQGEISGLLRSKSFGEKKARKMEQKIGLPVGWLDTPDEPKTPTAASATQDRPALVPVEVKSKADVSLVWVDGEELALLTAYRQATALGKSTILVATEIAERNPAALFGHQL